MKPYIRDVVAPVLSRPYRHSLPAVYYQKFLYPNHRVQKLLRWELREVPVYRQPVWAISC